LVSAAVRVVKVHIPRAHPRLPGDLRVLRRRQRLRRALVFTIYHLLSIIYYLSFVFYYLLFTIYYLLSIVYYLLFTIYYLLSVGQVHVPRAHPRLPGDLRVLRRRQRLRRGFVFTIYDLLSMIYYL